MSSNNRFYRRRAFIVPVTILLLAVVVFAILEVTHTTHVFTAKKTSTANQYTKGDNSKPVTTGTNSSGSTTGTSGSTTQNSGTSTSGGNDKNQGSESTGNSGAAPLTPTGTFVSNYQPNLSGSPKPNLIQSVCNTTPGATCQISFTKDGVTKSLKATSTDGGGAAYWTWKLQDIGITAGTWKITATSSLNGKTAAATDSIPFEVSE